MCVYVSERERERGRETAVIKKVVGYKKWSKAVEQVS